jgi:hypothetical protein
MVGKGLLQYNFTYIPPDSVVCGVSKKFGEWYQKTNKTEDTNKLIHSSFLKNSLKMAAHCQNMHEFNTFHELYIIKCI